MDPVVQTTPEIIHEELWKMGSLLVQVEWFTITPEAWFAVRDQYPKWKARPLTPDLLHVHRVTSNT
jgi:hypothetical protein